MRIAILLMSGLVASGCSAPGDRDATPDSHVVPAATPAAAAAAAADPAQAPAMSGVQSADSARSACAAVRTLAEHTLGIRLVADDADSFEAPRELGRWSGCRYTATFAMSSDSAPSNRLHAALTASGWRNDIDWDADGADGAEYAFVHAPALCHVSFAVPEAGDEHAHDDGDAVPRARDITYQLEIRCTAPVPALRTSSQH